MCGILGHWSFAETLSEPLLRAGLAELQNRGPDAQGLWWRDDQKLALGHTRLALRGGTSGQQPLHSTDGRLHAVVNGELYQDRALRQRAQAQGYRFATDSDSELVLALYQLEGLAFVRFLQGEFAFVLYDQAQDLLIAARDRFGIKPLYYARNSQSLMLASKISPLLAMGHPRRWDLDSLYDAYQWQYVLPDKTLVKDVQQVPPGHLLISRVDSSELLSYWDLDYAQVSDLQIPATTDLLQAQIRERLDTAVAERMAADAPIAAHLSGGLDSCSVLALMQEQARIQDRPPITAFHVAFSESPDYNEQQQAQAYAAYLGADLVSVPVTCKEIMTHYALTVARTEGLSINAHTVAKYCLNQALRQAGFKAALTGEGADEVFLGYAHFRQDLGLAANNPLVSGLHTALPSEHDLSEVQQVLGYVPSWIAAKAQQGQRLMTLLQAASRPTDSLAYWQSFFDHPQLKERHPVHRSAWLWTKLALANYILPTVGDGAEMAHSIEGRLPFLDHVIFESLRGLHPQCHFGKQPPYLEKSLLRHSLAALLPPELVHRPKHPFLAPPLSQQPLWQNYLNESFASLPAAPFVNQKALSVFIQQLPALTPDQHRLWDPVLHFLLSATHLQAALKLT